MNRAEAKAAVEAAIIEVIDLDDHYCIAVSEGQACCIDPRLPGNDGDGYGGEAIRAGLLDRILDICGGPQ